MDNHIQKVHQVQLALADKGSITSSEEIQGILEVMKNVTLKLVVTNIPSVVYQYDIAKDAFEHLFRSFDSEATFVYLPSFRRALVYMTRPEAALLARLQTQGWKLPQCIYDNIQDNPQSNLNTGINCYIGDIGDNFESDEVSNNDGEDDEQLLEEEECNCCKNHSDSCDRDENCLLDEELKSHGTDNIDKRIQEQNSPAFTSNEFMSQVCNNDGLENFVDFHHSSATTKIITTGTSDCDNTSEASGDDGTTVAVSLANKPIVSKRVCCKHKKRKKGILNRFIKHLAPPKPSRLFWLSPPASPPVGWEPKPESEPVINYDLLQALASLSPGEAFELHPCDQANSRPSIVVTPCEAESKNLIPITKPRIVQTRCPDRNNKQ